METSHDSDELSCDKCNIPFSDKGSLKMHGDCPKVKDTISSLNHKKIALNNKESNLKISEKRVNIKQNQEADNTVKTIDEEYEKFFICKETSPNKNLLIDNAEKNDLKISDKQKTEEVFNEEYEEFFNCEETCPNINLLTDNADKKDIATKCYFCDIKFTDELSLSKHMKITHKTEGTDIDIVAKDTPSKCHDCDTEFTNETTLINHKENIHKAEKSDLRTIKYHCCGTEFTDKLSLSNHTKITHKTEEGNLEISGKSENNCTDPSIIDPDDLTIVCNNCVVEFTEITSFGDHINNHTHEGRIAVSIKCPYCKTKFENRPLLDNHMKNDHNAKIDAIDVGSEGPIFLNPDYFTYTCKWRENCNAEISKKEQFINHLRYHLEEKQPNKIKDLKMLIHCQYCKKAPRYRISYLAHENFPW